MNLPLPHLAALLAAAFAFAPHRAVAESTERGDRSAAGDAYRHAQRAAVRGDAAEAARLFELADVLSPSPEALRSATRARLSIGHDARAATNAALLLERHGDDARSRELAESVLTAHAPDFLRVTIACDAPCRISVGARAAALRRSGHHVMYVPAGDHELVISFADGSAISRSVAGGPGATVLMRVRPPAPVYEAPQATRTSPPRRLDRRWFAASLVTTVGLAAGAAWSHEEARGERLTGLLIGGALGSAMTTIVFAAVTDWSRAAESAPSGGMRLGATRGGATVGWGGRF